MYKCIKNELRTTWFQKFATLEDRQIDFGRPQHLGRWQHLGQQRHLSPLRHLAKLCLTLTPGQKCLKSSNVCIYSFCHMIQHSKLQIFSQVVRTYVQDSLCFEGHLNLTWTLHNSSHVVCHMESKSHRSRNVGICRCLPCPCRARIGLCRGVTTPTC